ncbi:MAG: hypothetical protein Q8N18_05870 [Opitutaceae bacterium]|nr:hypothetical protein [Opitutaceae bacterium]
MKKLLIILGLLAILAVAAVVYVSMNLGQIVTAGVNRYGPQLTQTKLTLESARISPFSGIGTLNGLVIGNPKGWSDANLASLGKIHLDVVPSSLRGDHIIINEVIIEAPVFNYETKIISSNVADLLANIEQALGGAKPAADGKTQPAASGAPVKFSVKKFRLLNGSVRVGLGPAATIVPLPAMEIDELGTKEGGITVAQAASVVMNQIVGKIVGVTAGAASDLLMTGGAASAESMKKAGEAIKGLFGGGKDTTKKEP